MFRPVALYGLEGWLGKKESERQVRLMEKRMLSEMRLIIAILAVSSPVLKPTCITTSLPCIEVLSFRLFLPPTHVSTNNNFCVSPPSRT
ncbi:hypothetical protein Y032_0050g2029 [Ancylostoma ceylanicum]|uniref:Uncharacterized protein n=1 Tax=Ancylostoma ceylanicum TaxID=53326 RepID=A0A016U9Y0_9BILA|nr:hypothetical protein Y032_0050g2029 [Ancylostoma ceylanicum]